MSAQEQYKRLQRQVGATEQNLPSMVARKSIDALGRMSENRTQEILHEITQRLCGREIDLTEPQKLILLAAVRREKWSSLRDRLVNEHQISESEQGDLIEDLLYKI